MNRLKFIESNHMEGRICLVTGASRGTGFQTALGLASMGAFVVLVGHNQQRGEKATDFMLVDLSSQEQIREFAETIKARYDRLDVLVNNAGGFCLKHHRSIDLNDVRVESLELFHDNLTGDGP